MSKSANKTLIGAFTAGAIALLVIALAVFGSGMLFNKTARFVLFFEKSITGLSIGSPVVFQGVRVGRVVSIQLDGDMTNMHFAVPVYIDLDLENQHFLTDQGNEMEAEAYVEKFIDRGLRANLATQSFITGQLMIELSFVADASSLTAEDKKQYHGFTKIPTVPSSLESIWHRLTSLPYEQIGDNIVSITERIKSLVGNTDLQNASASLNEILAKLNSLVSTMESTFKEIDTLASTYTGLAKNMDAGLSKGMGEVTEDISKTLASVTAAVKQAEKTVLVTRGLVDKNGVTVQELNKALRDVSEAARAVRVLANTLERNPEALLRGKGGR